METNEQKFWFDGFVKDDKFVPMAGPFATREEADEIHHRAAKAALGIDARSWWMTWGVASLADGSVRGKLNEMLGVKPFTNEQDEKHS